MDNGKKCGRDEPGGERPNGAQQNAKNKTAEKYFFDDGNGDRRRRDSADAAPRNGILHGKTADPTSASAVKLSGSAARSQPAPDRATSVDCGGTSSRQANEFAKNEGAAKEKATRR